MDDKATIIAIVMLFMAMQVHAAFNCTAAGRFADPTDTTCKNYTLCVYVSSTNSFAPYNYTCPTTSLFNPNTSKCTTNYICNNDATTNNTNKISVCTAEGLVPDPGSTNCTTFIQCIEINETFMEYPISCPIGYYNPNTTQCELDYICPFTCTTSGRFADTSDSTCQSYYFCILTSNGTFDRYNFTCPSTSVFSPMAKICTSKYICTS